MQAKGSPCNWFTSCHFLKVANPYAYFNLTHTAEREWQIISKVNFSDLLPEKTACFLKDDKIFSNWTFVRIFLISQRLKNYLQGSNKMSFNYS